MSNFETDIDVWSNEGGYIPIDKEASQSLGRGAVGAEVILDTTVEIPEVRWGDEGPVLN